MKVREYLGKALAWLKGIPLWVWCVLVGLFVVTNYLPNMATMIKQNAWINVIETGATVNFVLFLLIYSNMLDGIVKKLGWKVRSLKGVGVWLGGMALLVAVLRVTGNFATIFG